MISSLPPACYLFSTWLDNIFSTGLIFVSKLTFFSIGSGRLRTQILISASKSSGPGVSTPNFVIFRLRIEGCAFFRLVILCTSMRINSLSVSDIA